MDQKVTPKNNFKNFEKLFLVVFGYKFLTIRSTDKLSPFLELTDSNLFGLYYVIFSSVAISIYKIIFKEENIHAKFTFLK